MKALLLAALVSAAAVSANAGVRFGFSIGIPAPLVVVRPVAYAPIVVASQVMVAPVPVVVAAVPPCPGVDYVWAPGYWGYRGHDRVWVGGGWNYHPGYGGYGHYYGGCRR